MAVRDDILNFMRSIKAGKQAAQESETKLSALQQAQTQHQQTLEGYARQLTAYETELPNYQADVASWGAATDALRQGYETSLAGWQAMQGPQWDAYRSNLQAYSSWVPKITEYAHQDYPGGPIYWNTNNWGNVINSREVDNPVPQPPEPRTPAAPTSPTYPSQPQMTVAHPGDVPSFEFVMGDTPYSAALAKSSQASSMPSLRSANQGDYYRAIEAQANQPKWWERN